MLVLRRKSGEAVMIGDNIEVQVLGVEGDTVKLGFSAPANIQILRKELMESILQENLEAGKNQLDQGQLLHLLDRFADRIYGQERVLKMMVSLNGVNAPKIDPPITMPVSAEQGSLVKDRVASERSEARAVNDRIADKTAGKLLNRFDKMSEEDKERLQEMLDKHNQQFAYTGKYLKFHFDEEASTMYVQVIDSATQEVIVSLPPEFLIDLSIKIKKILGLYIDEKL